MVNIIIFLGLSFLLIFSTFFIVQLPFILLFFNNIPPEVSVFFSNDFITIGTFPGNFQIPVIILSALLLNPRLSFVFIMAYFIIGFSGNYPIFYSGGGKEYLEQLSAGYIIGFFPVVILISNFAWLKRDFNKYLFNSKYIFFISLSGLLLIHLIGLANAFILLKKDTSVTEILKIYFFIPFLSQVLLVFVVSVFSTYFNYVKYLLLTKYVNSTDSIIKKSTKRRKLVK